MNWRECLATRGISTGRIKNNRQSRRERTKRVLPVIQFSRWNFADPERGNVEFQTGIIKGIERWNRKISLQIQRLEKIHGAG